MIPHDRLLRENPCERCAFIVFVSNPLSPSEPKIFAVGFEASGDFCISKKVHQISRKMFNKISEKSSMTVAITDDLCDNMLGESKNGIYYTSC